MKWAIKYIYPAKVFDIIFEYQYPSDEIGDIDPGNFLLTYHSKFSLWYHY
jgi:hypothetical protein